MNNIQKQEIINQVTKEVVKQFAANSFEAHVKQLAKKEYAGDTIKARAEILTNRAKHPVAYKQYVAARNVKNS
jgi:hypothetical protein